MISCNKTAIYSALIFIVSYCCFVAKGVFAQNPADFQRFHEHYPSNPFIQLQNEASLEISMDKQGKPVFTITESDVKLVLTDNFPELSEMRNYYNASDVVKYIDAYSLVPSGDKFNKIKIPDLKKMTDDDNSYYYNDTYCMVGHFPSVKKGTLLHNHQKYISSDIDVGYRFLFGNYVPVESASLTVTFPDNVKIIWRYAGKDTSQINFSSVKKGNFTSYNWKCETLKGYTQDNLSPSHRYFLPHIIISVAGYDYKGNNVNVMGNIDDLHKWEHGKLKNINTQIHPLVKALADSITSGFITPRKKVEAIYKWVQEKIKYIAIEDGENGFVPQQAETVLARKYGDCKDKSSILTALIRATGQEASFACVGTRKLPYSFTKYPVIGSANHLIAVWWDENKNPVILDGTTRFCAVGEIPSFIQGKECLIMIDSLNYMVYNIPVFEPHKNLTSDTLYLKIEGKNLYGNGVLAANGEGRTELLYKLEGKDSKKQNDLLSEILGFAGNKLVITDCKWITSQNVIDPVIARYNIELPDYCVTSGNQTYVNLNLHQHLSSLDLKQDRTIPIETENTYQNKITTVLTVPEGHTLVQIPENSSYSHPKFSFSITYSNVNNTVIKNTSISIGFLLIEGEDITAFRDMILQLKQAYRKTIMLRKNT